MRPAAVVDIHKSNLDQIEQMSGGGVRIGALVTNTDLAFNDHVRSNYPVLSQALRSVASTQLCNKAITAGNIMQRVRCGYCRDGISLTDRRLSAGAKLGLPPTPTRVTRKGKKVRSLPVQNCVRESRVAEEIVDLLKRRS